MRIGITCYPTYGGSGVVATELGKAMAQRGHQIHFISYALPFRLQHYDERIFFHEVEMVNYPLLEHSTLRHRAGGQDVRGRAPRSAWISSTCTTPSPTPSRPSWRAPSWARGRPASSRPCTAPTSPWSATTVPCIPMTRFALEQSDGVTCVSEYLADEDAGRLQSRSPHGSDPELRRHPTLSARAVADTPRASGPARRADPRAPLQLPPR